MYAAEVAAATRSAVCGESGRGSRRPPSPARCRYAIPASVSEARSAAWPNCGWMRIRRVWNTPCVADVSIRPVSPDQHDAVMHYFDLVAYADNPNWSRCFCTERLVSDYDSRTKEQNRELRSELIRSARANGLVAYRLGRVV